jgi:hypothetical protein
MKKLILVFGIFASSIVFGQTFSDNFDSYTAGSYLCPQSAEAWTTWSNAPGGTEDVLVSNAEALSGANSLYFASTASSGGPTDLVHNFGVLNTGQFSMEFNIKVQTGKAAYFNLQRNETIGEVWSMDCNFADNGDLIILNQTGLYFTSTYTQNQWFNFRMDINFNTNVWEVFIDDVSVGSFANTENQIASIDIFPVDQNTPFSCGYFFDDFEYTVIPYTLPTVNGAANLLSYNQGNLVGTAVTPNITVRNLGVDVITSATITVDYNGTNISNDFTGLSLASLATITLEMPSTLSLIAGTNTMTATLSNVNGAFDGDAGDDQTSIVTNAISPALGKMVVGEEGTGTWCQWCPRGAVFMDMMESKYPGHWAGIAVHNADPMTVTEYDAALTVSGYPSALVDRGTEMDPSEMEVAFLDNILIAPSAFITNGANWDAATRVLDVSVSANFQTAADNNYKLAIVLSEDEVTGTGSTYGQSNAYAGGSAGVMGGYELLSNPVPASQMVYNHVARAIAPSFGGTNIAFPATINSGETYTINASFTLPSTWDETQMHIVSMLVNQSGTVNNAGKATLTEAIANGFVLGTPLNNVGIADQNQIDANLAVYPNPANEYTSIKVQLKNEQNVTLKLIDMNGRTVASRNYGQMNGASEIHLNTSNFEAGLYLIQLTLDNTIVSRRLIIE